MKLPKLSDYIISLEKGVGFYESKIDFLDGETADKQLIVNLAHFLQQKLSEPYDINGVSAHPLNRYVPTDLEGNVLDVPMGFWDWHGLSPDEVEKCKQYQEALDRVIFEGLEVKESYVRDEFVLDNNVSISKIRETKTLLDCVNGEFEYKTIEDLTSLELTLTKSGEQLLNN
jgi:hypothetical protein